MLIPLHNIRVPGFHEEVSVKVQRDISESWDTSKDHLSKRISLKTSQTAWSSTCLRLLFQVATRGTSKGSGSLVLSGFITCVISLWTLLTYWHCESPSHPGDCRVLLHWFSTSGKHGSVSLTLFSPHIPP